MTITIAQKVAPFSHRPGASCLIPGTHLVLRAFPTRLQWGEVDLHLGLTGPVEDFTVLQDLERDCVFVYGRAQEGFYRLRVQAEELVAERLFEGGLKVSGSWEGVLQKKQALQFPGTERQIPSSFERLSLGSHKAQDWDLVVRRFDLREILPVLYLLGQKTPPGSVPQPLSGTARLLELPSNCREVLAALERLCRAAFSEILVPRLQDTQYQGLCLDEVVEEEPFFLLREAFLRVRALFFQSSERFVSLLPCNPFEAGRLLGVRAPGIGTFDLEWRKKILRRALFYAEMNGSLTLQLQRQIGSLRVEGIRQSPLKPLTVEAGKRYRLDRFEK